MLSLGNRFTVCDTSNHGSGVPQCGRIAEGRAWMGAIAGGPAEAGFTPSTDGEAAGFSAGQSHQRLVTVIRAGPRSVSPLRLLASTRGGLLRPLCANETVALGEREHDSVFEVIENLLGYFVVDDDELQLLGVVG